MEPQFEGQTKTKLGNKEVTSAVSKSVSDMLTFYLEENPILLLPQQPLLHQ